MTDDTQNSPGSEANPIVIKKYANRRLYNTDSSSYITLDTLHQMVRDDTQFIVCDARTGEDITRSVLTQIILEEEAKGNQTLLPISFLRQLIGFYGDQFHHLTLPNYLESAMQAFLQNQDQFRKLTESSMGSMFPLGNFEHLQRQNMEFLQNAFGMFNPLMAKTAASTTKPAAVSPKPATDELSELKQQIAELKSEIRTMKS